MVWLEVLIILTASRTACFASDADTAKRLVIHDSWSDWSACTRSCGGGHMTRTQTCHHPNGPSHVCDTQKQVCETQHCPITVPIAAHWSAWSSCSVTCGNGESVRQWICSTHIPLIGKRSTCTPHSERQTCSPGSCPIAVLWSAWSSCSVTCGNGESIRQRICSTHVPLFGNRSTCTQHLERQTCSPGSCPTDGNWGSWSEWSMCPVTCVAHSQSRHRECNNPFPSNGGRQCDGLHMESRNCPLSACHIDGNWSGWSEFSKCTVSCGLGTQMRSRSCSNPAPRNGGLDCLGSSMEAIICSFPTCVLEPRVCDKMRLMSSIFHNNSVSQKGDTSCTDPSYHSSRALIQELCNAPSTSLHFGSQVIDVCNQIPTFSPVVRKDDITGHTDYGILIECHGNQLKVASQDCTHNVHIANLDGTESTKYYVVNW